MEKRLVKKMQCIFFHENEKIGKNVLLDIFKSIKIVKVTNAEHPVKIELCCDVIDTGYLIVLNLEQPLNELAPSVSIVVGRIKSTKLIHLQKAYAPIYVIPSIVTDEITSFLTLHGANSVSV